MLVNHSQRLSNKPLIPWIIAEPSGKIMTGHCNCVAGLGETCSHVASLLWAIEAGVHIRDSTSHAEMIYYCHLILDFINQNNNFNV